MTTMEKAVRVKRKKPITRDTVFDAVNVLIMCILFVVFTWPLWFIVIASVSDPISIWNGEVLLLPKNFSLDSYIEILHYNDIWLGYRNTIFYTVVGTLINLAMTILCAYPLSRGDFVLNNFFTKMFMFTMYFTGGLIPTYLVVDKLGLTNTIWALMIPNAISFYNVIITRTYFKNSIPVTLQEAAELDGANTWQYLWKVVLPLSKPILAVMALYYGTAHWNNFFNALIYINDSNLYPLQMFLRSILINNTFNSEMMEALDPVALEAMMRLAETMKYGIIIVSTLPVLCIYPFVQKYFVKGVMIGAVKG